MSPSTGLVGSINPTLNLAGNPFAESGVGTISPYLTGNGGINIGSDSSTSLTNYMILAGIALGFIFLLN